MYGFYRYRYLLGFTALGVLLIALIILIISGGSKTNKTLPKTLDSYSNTDAEVSLTIVGPITADQLHQSINITISNSTSTYEQLQGYQGQVTNLQTFPNNVNSFTEFLFALERAGFTDGNKSTALQNDQGYCPLGDRYIFELTQDNQQLERYWSTNCGGTQTYLGQLDLTLSLFQNQIPNYSTLSGSVAL
jgi:predicted PurR-regulated permease PerM